MKKNLVIKKIKRDSFKWGVFDPEKEEFIGVFEHKDQAETYIKNYNLSPKVRIEEDQINRMTKRGKVVDSWTGKPKKKGKK